MKISVRKRFIMTVLAIFVLAAALPGLHASAASDIYVNTSSDTLSGGLQSAYAIGGDGNTSKLGSTTTVYAMTGNGLASIGAPAGGTGDTSHLPVTGSVNIKYSRLRVGLYYYDGTSSIRNPTLDTANLENAVGSGYKFGYYDSSRNFYELGSTSETKLTMASDKNLDTAGGHLGAYHIQLSGTYNDFASAQSAASAYGDGFPAYYNGQYYALVGSYDSAADATSAAASRGINGSAYSASNRCVVVTRTSDAKILFEFNYGSTYSLAIRPQSSGSKAVTWFKGYRYNGDFEYSRRNGDKLTVVNIVDMEDYVKGVIPYEMGGSWPLEALKAQALCARTFAASHFNSYSTYGFDVTCDTYSQVYHGTGSSTANSNNAVDSTAGEYITYNGGLIAAMYSSSFGGGSENSENVFGTAYGYLKGVVDPYESAANNVNKKSSWSYTFSKSDLAAKLSSFGKNISNISSVDVTLSPTGNAIAIRFTSSSGSSVTLTGNDCYRFSTSTLKLPAIHYTVTDSGSSITFDGGGYGHNVGLSQYGAYAMSTSYGFTYDQIVNFYYTGVALSRGVYNG